jgi:hypothetical protein
MMFVPFCSANTLQSQGSLMDAMIARHFIGSAPLLEQSVQENAPHQTDQAKRLLDCSVMVVERKGEFSELDGSSGGKSYLVFF